MIEGKPPTSKNVTKKLSCKNLANGWPTYQPKLVFNEDMLLYVNVFFDTLVRWSFFQSLSDTSDNSRL